VAAPDDDNVVHHFTSLMKLSDGKLRYFFPPMIGRALDAHGISANEARYPGPALTPRRSAPTPRRPRTSAPMPRRKPRGRPLDGWLIIDKPPGLTSTDVVNRVRRAFDAQKAGHGGTLDPLATGVLPIAFGAATKTVPYVMDGTKLYRFTLRFGEARETDDADGKLTATSPVRPTDEQIRAASEKFRGDIMQVPPTFSAVKVAGERAYDMAREGRPPNLEPRPARVDRFELIERPNEDTAIFEVASGKGVYMRSLARDLAQACGTFGHITALRRLRVGPFTEAQAKPLDKLRATDDTAPASPDLLLPVATALADIPALALTEAEVSGLRHGQAISLVTLMGRIPGSADPAGGLVRAMAGGCVIGLARLEDGWMKPARML
jgi:tRNA pseudouridine55 synthase